MTCRFRLATRYLLSIFLLLAAAPFAQGADQLPSWNDGPSKQSVVAFVERVTAQGSPDFVPPAERIAVFDNDGTLWGEQPMYFQLLFALDRIKALAPQHPEWNTQEPFANAVRDWSRSILPLRPPHRRPSANGPTTGSLQSVAWTRDSMRQIPGAGQSLT